MGIDYRLGEYMGQETDALVHLRLFLVAVIWGAAWTSGRHVATNIPPFTGAMLRYVIAVPFFVLILAWREGLLIGGEQRFGLYLPRGDRLRAVALIGFFSTLLYQVLFMLGVRWTAAGDASLVITLNPLITAVLAIAVLGHRFTMRTAIGLGLGLAGIMIIALGSPNDAIPLRERLLGDAMILLGAAAWATSTILMKQAMSPTGGQIAMTPLALTTWASVAGLLYLLPLSLIEVLWTGLPVIEQSVWLNLIYLSIISTVIAYVWFAEGVDRIGPDKAALYVYLVPIFGILSGWAFLDEQLGMGLLFSFILIVAGVRIASAADTSALTSLEVVVSAEE